MKKSLTALIVILNLSGILTLINWVIPSYLPTILSGHNLDSWQDPVFAVSIAVFLVSAFFSLIVFKSSQKETRFGQKAVSALLLFFLICGIALSLYILVPAGKGALPGELGSGIIYYWPILILVLVTYILLQINIANLIGKLFKNGYVVIAVSLLSIGSVVPLMYVSSQTMTCLESTSLRYCPHYSATLEETKKDNERRSSTQQDITKCETLLDAGIQKNRKTDKENCYDQIIIKETLASSIYPCWYETLDRSSEIYLVQCMREFSQVKVSTEDYQKICQKLNGISKERCLKNVSVNHLGE